METQIIDQQQLRRERIARNATLFGLGFFIPNNKEFAEIKAYEALSEGEQLPAIAFGPAAVQAAEVELDYGNLAVAR